MRPIVLLGGLAAALMCSSGVALAQKSGGVLKMYHRDNPPSASTARGGDQFDGRAVHVAVQQPGALRPGQAAEQPAGHRPRPRQVVELERRQQGPHLQAAGRREVARRPALHRQGRHLHLRPADRQGRGQAAPQPAPLVVRQCRQRHRQRRSRGHGPSQAPAALDPVAAGLGLFADLSLPYPVGADAHQADRHRALQVRRVQAERRHQGHQEHRLLEEGAALSRRHRVHHRAQPGDGDAELRLRPLRHHLPVGGDDPAPERHQEPAAQRGVPGHLDEQHHQPDPQSRRAAVRQSRSAPRAGARIDRKSFVDILNQGDAELGGTMQPPGRRVGPAPGDL